MDIGQALPLAKILGADSQVPLLSGGTTRYINLDNAATTPPFQRVWDRLAEVMPLYGSVHRGSGFKSIISTRLLEEGLARILAFSDGHPETDLLILGWNTTSCINHLARRLGLNQGSLVITSEREHSSNVLPWRKHAKVLECPTTDDGTIDLNHLEFLLKTYRAQLVSVTGASNVTGTITDVHSVARLAHNYGAQIFVDAAQLVAHRKLDRRPFSSPEHLDFVAYAGHKMYAPFGLGVLVGDKEVFREGWPDTVGGGTIRLIDGDEIVWADLPEREAGGTPNFPGVIALAEACDALLEIGFKKIAEHEQALIQHARVRLTEVPGITIHRSLSEASCDSAAVFPFSLKGYHHSLVSAFLGTERGIGVRAGHLCQFALIRHVLNISDEERDKIRRDVKAGNRRSSYGIVRASCGLGTTIAEIDILAEALQDLVVSGPSGHYEQSLDGEYKAQGWSPSLPFGQQSSQSALFN